LKIKGVFDPKIRQWNKERAKQLLKYYKSQAPNARNVDIWIHCASLGEYQQIASVIELIKLDTSDVFILLSFFSPSGYENVKNTKADEIIYLPLDKRKDMKKLIDYYRPRIFLGVKYEWWWNLFDELNQRKIPKVLVAVKFDKSHYIFQWYSKRFAMILRNNTIMFCQDQSTSELVISLGIQNVKQIGDPRVDTVLRKKDNPYVNANLFLKLAQAKEIIVYGSVYQDDLKIIGQTIKDQEEKFHIVVPHDISVANIKAFQESLHCKSLFSKIQNFEFNKNVVIIDTIGELFGLYSIASYCYIGGGFTKNVHNTLEPAVFGMPICIGPKHKGFAEIDYFKKHNLIKIITQNYEFSTFLKNVTPSRKEEISNGLDLFFERSKGSSFILSDYLQKGVRS
jgi:3-deoxy-D-manno-octulosonic-acid transferase